MYRPSNQDRVRNPNGIVKVIGLLEQMAAQGPKAPAVLLSLWNREYRLEDLPQAIARLRQFARGNSPRHRRDAHKNLSPRAARVRAHSLR